MDKELIALEKLVFLRTSYTGQPNSAVCNALTDTQTKIIAKFDELILKCVEAITLEPEA